MNAIVQKFKRLFREEFVNYDFTELENVEAGFSLRDTYSKKQVKKLKIEDGHQYVPYFNYLLKRDVVKNIDGVDYYPVHINVEATLRDSDPDNGFRYVIDDRHINTKLNKPINFRTNDEFYFHKKGEFYRSKKGKLIRVKLSEIHKLVFRLHIAKYSSIVGIKARAKVFTLRLLPRIAMNVISNIFGLFVWLINGEFYTYDPIMAELEEEYGGRRTEPKEAQKEDDIDFFGYQVKTWTLFSYSILVISFVYLSSYFELPTKLLSLETNALVNISIAIITIVTYDKIAPLYLRKAIRILGNKKFALNIKGVKLSI